MGRLRGPVCSICHIRSDARMSLAPRSQRPSENSTSPTKVSDSRRVSQAPSARAPTRVTGPGGGLSGASSAGGAAFKASARISCKPGGKPFRSTATARRTSGSSCCHKRPASTASHECSAEAVTATGPAMSGAGRSGKAPRCPRHSPLSSSTHASPLESQRAPGGRVSSFTAIVSDEAFPLGAWRMKKNRLSVEVSDSVGRAVCALANEG